MKKDDRLSKAGAEIVEALSGFLDTIREGAMSQENSPSGRSKPDLMPHQKPSLPTKICPACGRPFAWRKKWQRDWERVVYCSDACRRKGKEKPPG